MIRVGGDVDPLASRVWCTQTTIYCQPVLEREDSEDGGRLKVIANDTLSGFGRSFFIFIVGRVG